VVRGACGPLGRFFFGASEKLNSTAARFAGTRGVFVVRRRAFLFLLDFTMNTASTGHSPSPGINGA
jgi:hypothetical protein